MVTLSVNEMGYTFYIQDELNGTSDYDNGPLNGRDNADVDNDNEDDDVTMIIHFLHLESAVKQPGSGPGTPEHGDHGHDDPNANDDDDLGHGVQGGG